MAEQPKPKFGYWYIRGLAQAQRTLLHYTNTPYEEVTYLQGDGPEFSRQEWLDVKFTLDLDFPNLPYYIDGDFKITESCAILRYIADKNNLLGKDPETRAWVSMLEQIMVTWRNGNSRVAYKADYADLMGDLIKDVESKYLGKVSGFLKKQPWLAGTEITYIDFMCYELLLANFAMEPTLREKYPVLREYMERFEALPAIKDYLKSPEVAKYPFNNKSAGWGNKVLSSD